MMISGLFLSILLHEKNLSEDHSINIKKSITFSGVSWKNRLFRSKILIHVTQIHDELAMDFVKVVSQTYPSSRQRREQATGSRWAAPLGAPRLPLRWALAHPMNQGALSSSGAKSAADALWKKRRNEISAQTNAVNMSKAATEEGKKKNHQAGLTGLSEMRMERPQGFRCAGGNRVHWRHRCRAYRRRAWA